MPLLFRKTRRLIIRVLTPKDYEAWKASHLNKLPKQNRWDQGPRPLADLTPKKFQHLLRTQKSLRDKDHFFQFVVVERKTGSIVGSLGAMDIQRGLCQSAYLGYAIYNRYWGMGFGKESVLALIDIAFRDLKLHRLEAGVEPGNRRSILLARSLGLRKEGLKKRAVLQRDQWVDLLIYSATCDEFGIKWTGKAKRKHRH